MIHTQSLQFFKDRIGKRIFRNETTCPCPSCKDVFENGKIIIDEQDAEYLYEIQNTYAEEGIDMGYRDEK